MSRAICFSIFLALFTWHSSADVIYLKNGKKIECESAWQEGKTIRYKISSGTVSLPQSIVDRIEKAGAIASPQVPPDGSASRNDALTQDRLARFYTDRGMELLQKKDFPKAQQQFEKAYSYQATEITTLNLAISYYYLKDDWNSENFFREVLTRNPENTTALNYLGELHWRKDELEDAEHYWERSLTVKDDPEVRQKLQKLEKEQQIAEHYESEKSDHFIIRFDGGTSDPEFAGLLSTFLEEAFQQLSTQYEVYPSEPFVIILYPKQQFLNAMDVPVWSAGANDGKIKLPVKGLKTITEDLKKILLHELSHSFVSLKTMKNSPGWLQEGLAKYCEGERLSAPGRMVLRNQLSTRSLPALRSLEGSFAKASTQTASIFYLQSLSFVEYLLTRHNFLQMNQFLERLGQQEPLKDAFEAAYLVPLDEMEKNWRSELALNK